MTARKNGIGIPDRTEPQLCEAHSMLLCRLCSKVEKAPFGTVRKPLEKKPQTRHIRQADYLQLIGVAKSSQGGRCVGHLAGIEHDCEDPFDFIHAVDQQTIVRKLGAGHPALTDPRLGGYACRLIHTWFDQWGGKLRDVDDREQFVACIHPDLHAAVAEHGLEVELERKVEGAA